MNKKIKATIISVAVFAVVALLVFTKDNKSDTPQKTNISPGKAAASPVKAHIIKPETLSNNVVTSGTVLANEEVDLKSEISGKIIRIFFREGSSVKAGELLVKIDDKELQAQLKRARFNAKLLEDREYRQKVLLEKEAISREDYDVSLNELNVVRSEIELIEAQIEKTEIRAPFNGVVGLKSVSQGSIIGPDAVIATLQNINPVKIDFSIPEKYASMVKISDPVNFKIVGADETYTAKVYATDPKIDPLTRTLRIRALYSNPTRKILPGSFADIELVLGEVNDAIMIPSHSIVPELKGQRVFVYKNGVALPKKIDIGVRTATKVQVTDGLSENDTLITSGILQIRPNSPVTISGFN